MKEYKDKSVEDLHKLVAEKKTQLQSMRFGKAGSKSKNVHEGALIRKEIARMLTEVSSRK